MKYFNYIVLGLLVVIILQGFFTVPKEVSEEEVLYRIALDSLKDERIKDLTIINELENKNRIYENFYDSLKNDNSIDTFTANQLQFSLSNYAKRR